MIWIENNTEKYKISSVKCNKKRKRLDKQKKYAKKYRSGEKYAEWVKENKDKIRQYNKYRYQHKYHKISKTEWEDCKYYFNYKCAYCGLPIEEHHYTRSGIIKLGDFHKEHVVNDGANDLSNCIPSCRQCNSEKRKESLNEWYNEQNYKYDKEKLNKILKWLNKDYKLYIKEE